MTSSLVGSEMCIRDSRADIAPFVDFMQSQAHKPKNKHLNYINRVLRFCTVSYTHLTLPTICSV
eukprot:2841745-Prorocentrum_lima.AAC.1